MSGDGVEGSVSLPPLVPTVVGPGINAYNLSDMVARSKSLPRKVALENGLQVFLGNLRYGVSPTTIVTCFTTATTLNLGARDIQMHYYAKTSRPRGSATLWVSTPEERDIILGFGGRLYFTDDNRFLVAETAQRLTEYLALQTVTHGHLSRAVVIELPKGGQNNGSNAGVANNTTTMSNSTKPAEAQQQQQQQQQKSVTSDAQHNPPVQLPSELLPLLDCRLPQQQQQPSQVHMIQMPQQLPNMVPAGSCVYVMLPPGQMVQPMPNMTQPEPVTTPAIYPIGTTFMSTAFVNGSAAYQWNPHQPNITFWQ